MPMLTTVLLWLVQSTAAGLVALALPRLFRLTNPGWLASWWGVVAGSVVLLPVGIALVPDAPAGRAVVSSFVESTAAALAPAAPSLVLPIGALLLTGWVTGGLARVGWLLAGARRLRRVASLMDRERALHREHMAQLRAELDALQSRQISSSARAASFWKGLS